MHIYIYTCVSSLLSRQTTCWWHQQSARPMTKTLTPATPVQVRTSHDYTRETSFMELCFLSVTTGLVGGKILPLLCPPHALLLIFSPPHRFVTHYN